MSKASAQRLLPPSQDDGPSPDAVLEASFALCPDGLVLFKADVSLDGATQDFTAVNCNEAACTLQHLSKDDIVGQRMSKLLPNMDAGNFERYVTVLRTGVAAEFESHYQDEAYDDWFRIYVSRIDAAHLMVLVKRITAEKRYEQALKRSRDALASFASVVSHDLRTPLGHISSFIDILREDLGDALTDDQSDYMGFITSGADHMRRLIDALQKHARLGQIEPDIGVIDTGRMVQDLADRFDVSFAEVGGALTLGMMDAIEGDQALMEQLLSNLLSNAIRYRSDDRPLRVDVTIKNTGKMAQIIVGDTGRGIAPEYRDKIFSLFNRGGETDAHETAMGLGLAICRGIAQAHGGDIHVRESASGGAQFHICLPQGNHVNLDEAEQKSCCSWAFNAC